MRFADVRCFLWAYLLYYISAKYIKIADVRVLEGDANAVV
jgi:hypothetical protein